MIARVSGVFHGENGAPRANSAVAPQIAASTRKKTTATAAPVRDVRTVTCPSWTSWAFHSACLADSGALPGSDADVGSG